MTSDQQLAKINSSFNQENIVKFTKGQEEHGGDFFEKSTVDCIREEAIDLVNYVHVLRLHKQELLKLINDFCIEQELRKIDYEIYKKALVIQSKIRNL